MVVLDRLTSGDHAVAPAFWAVEILNTLLVSERKGRITTDDSRQFFRTLRTVTPVLDCASLEQVAGPVQIICRDHRLSPYDALYVELAVRVGLPLATLDRAQKRAAIALGVPCL